MIFFPDVFELYTSNPELNELLRRRAIVPDSIRLPQEDDSEAVPPSDRDGNEGDES